MNKPHRFIVFHIRSTMADKSFYFEHHALAHANKLNVRDARYYPDQPQPHYAYASIDHYRTNVVHMVTRRNMMSGLEYEEPSNTPAHMSPSCDLDNPDQQYVSLCTTLYNDKDERIGSLSNSVFHADADDWETGTFDSVEEIPARCPHLREIAANLLLEYKSTIKTFSITIAANVRAYANIEIQAADEEAALKRADEIVASDNIWGEPEIKNENVVFEAEYDTLCDFEALDHDLVEEDDGEDE